MTMTEPVVSSFDALEQAEDAILELREEGIDMKVLSIVTTDTHPLESATGHLTTRERIMRWSEVGAVGRALWGLLFDSSLFVIPDLDPVWLSGPLVFWIVAVLEGTVVFGAIGALSASLVSIGRTNRTVVQSETQVSSGKFLLVAHETPAAIANTQEIFRGTRGSHTVRCKDVYAKSA